MIFHSSEKKARFMLWTTALIWGGGFVAGKMALTGLSPWGVLFWRFGLAALLFLLPFHKAIMGQGRMPARSRAYRRWMPVVVSSQPPSSRSP